MNPVAFHSFQNSDNVGVSVFINFPSKIKWDDSSHHIADECFCADLDSFCDQLSVLSCSIFDIYKHDACYWILWVGPGWCELMYISRIVNIRSRLIHLHGVQLLMLLEITEIIANRNHCFGCINRINLLYLL